MNGDIVKNQYFQLSFIDTDWSKFHVLLSDCIVSYSDQIPAVQLIKGQNTLCPRKNVPIFQTTQKNGDIFSGTPCSVYSLFKVLQHTTSFTGYKHLMIFRYM